MRISHAVTAALLFPALALAEAPAPASAPAPAPTAAAEPAVAPRSPEDVARRARPYATSGDVTVTVGDLEDAIAALSPYQRRKLRDEPASLEAFAKERVRVVVLAREARRRGLERAPRVREIVDGQLVQLLVHAQVDERVPQSSVPDADVDAYFAAHPEEFVRRAMVRASHVLLADEAEARALLATCREVDLAAFRQIARDRSLDDETKQAGGDLRYFDSAGAAVGGAGRPIDAALVAAAFQVPEVGECSRDVVRVGDRFSVLKLTGRRAEERTELPAARDAIRRRLWRTRRDGALEQLVEQVRGRVRIERHDDLVRLVQVTPPGPEDLVHRHGDAPELPEAPHAGHQPGR